MEGCMGLVSGRVGCRVEYTDAGVMAWRDIDIESAWSLQTGGKDIIVGYNISGGAAKEKGLELAIKAFHDYFHIIQKECYSGSVSRCK
jgi:CRISPR/Cas system CMR-associated protein Cmr3 (group 5 of RAMP superfamily)